MLLFAKLGEVIRLAPGVDASQKMLGLNQGFSAAFSHFFPTAWIDLLIGICGAGIMRVVVYVKSKNAKKYRKNIEYGSARWGTKKDIAPFMDPIAWNNIILTMTEGLMLSGRPKKPAFARMCWSSAAQAQVKRGFLSSRTLCSFILLMSLPIRKVRC